MIVMIVKWILYLLYVYLTTKLGEMFVNWTFFAHLLFAHLLADFCFQTDKIVKNKNIFHWKGYGIYLHSSIVFVLAWLFSFSFNFWWKALVVALSHFLVDIVKSYVEKKAPFRCFIYDQIVHVVILCMVSTTSCDVVGLGTICFQDRALPLLTIASTLIVLTKPANIMIQYYFNAHVFEDLFQIEVKKDEKYCRLEKVGAWIGGLERLLAFYFILKGSYQAVGFIITAKSILRFKESEGARAEYVLVGTLLSFSIAVTGAVVVHWIIG